LFTALQRCVQGRMVLGAQIATKPNETSSERGLHCSR
jgi:hypothetical protein